MNFDAALVPPEMKAAPHWVAWSYGAPDKPGGKPKKIPFTPLTSQGASSSSPSSWGSFEDAVASDRDGVGFMLGDGWAGVDLDHCMTDGEISNNLAHWIVATLNSYTEVSPSKTGLHTLVRGSHFHRRS